MILEKAENAFRDYVTNQCSRVAYDGKVGENEVSYSLKQYTRELFITICVTSAAVERRQWTTSYRQQSFAAFLRVTILRNLFLRRWGLFMVPTVCHDCGPFKSVFGFQQSLILSE
jgi:hypothetical protein